MDEHTLYTIAVALGLGFLVGLQREYDEHPIAGIRTFTLLTLFGTMMGFIGQQFNSSFIIVGGLLSVCFLLIGANYLKHSSGAKDIGQTTEVAALFMYAVGAYLVVGELTIGIILGGLVAVLLHLKKTLGGFVDNLAPKDIKAIMLFAALSMVILPILPNKTYGPYDVLNPREIWLMVVLIVGLGLVGYFIYKLMGNRVGTISSGILGGLISSTATTITYAKRSQNQENLGRLAAFIIMTASTIALLRIILEVAVVSPQYLNVIAPPLLVELVFMAIICLILYFYKRKKEDNIPEPKNPAQLKTALIFGALYGVILLAVAAGKDFFGEEGLLFVSLISGFTDVDAITLSLANTLNRGGIEVTNAWKYMLLASLSNLVFKGGIALFSGSKILTKYILVTFGLSIGFGLFLFFVWPAEWHF